MNTTEAVRCVVLVVALALQQTALGLTGEEILGHWVMPDGSALLRVEADNDSYRVKIVGLLEPAFTAIEAQPPGARTDIQNPDKTKRRRSLMDLVIARNLRFDGKRWKGGKIYDPSSGKTYRCELSLKGDYLAVRGFVGMSLFGRTMHWQRAAAYHQKVKAMLEAWNGRNLHLL